MWSPGLEKRVSRDTNTSFGMMGSSMGMEVVKENEKEKESEAETDSENLNPRGGRKGSGPPLFIKRDAERYERRKASKEYLPDDQFGDGSKGDMEGGWI